MRSLLSLLVLAAVAAPERPDPAVTYCFDLTRHANIKPVFLNVTLPAKVWQYSDHPISQIPKRAARRGWGAAWSYVEDPAKPGTTGKAYLEIEKLHERSLKTAAADAVRALEATCMHDKFRLKEPPGEPEIYGLLNFGHEKPVEALTIAYTVAPTKDPEAAYRARSLFFIHNGRFLTLTVYSFGKENLFDVFAKGLIPAKARPADQPYKLFFEDRNTSRFLVLQPPAGFVRNYNAKGTEAAVWERLGRRGKVLSRLTVGERWATHVGMKTWMVRRMESLRTRFQDIQGPTELQVSGLEGFRVSGREPVKGGADRYVIVVFVRLENQNYLFEIETYSQEPKALAADRELFEKVLASARIWAAR